MSIFFIKKRKFLKLGSAFLFFSFSKKIFSNGNPYRDRFQSYRQTFRIEPNREEAERILKNIIRKRNIKLCDK